MTTGLSLVNTGTASALCCWLLTSVPTPICLCKPFLCKACSFVPGCRPVERRLFCSCKLFSCRACTGSSIGEQSCPIPPRHSAVRPDATCRDLYGFWTRQVRVKNILFYFRKNTAINLKFNIELANGVVEVYRKCLA